MTCKLGGDIEKRRRKGRVEGKRSSQKILSMDLLDLILAIIEELELATIELKQS